MGEARRRGTKEERIAQAVERKKREAAASRERYLRDEAARRAAIAKSRSDEERRETFFTDERRPISVHFAHGGRAAILAAAAIALASPIRNAPLILLDSKPKDES